MDIRMNGVSRLTGINVHTFLLGIYIEMEFLGLRLYRYSNLVYVKWFSKVVIPNYRLISSV